MPVSSDKFGTYEIVVLDIEGTTTPITFVHDVLFPYARSEVRRYLEENWTTAKCQEAVRMLVQQAELDQQQGENSPRIISISDAKNSNKSAIIDSIVQNVYYNMEKDRKIPALKNLQGLIWEFGYKNSQLKGEVYDDVPVAFEEWKKHGVPIYIYSSGSVQAQKLLFENTNHGNLLTYIRGHYDTVHPGLKVEAKSYEIIANEIANGAAADKVLFVTDNLKEAESASKAGMKVVFSVRPKNNPVPEDHAFVDKVITSFAQLF